MSPTKLPPAPSQAVQSAAARLCLQFGVDVRDLRLARRWSVDAVARRAGVSRGHRLSRRGGRASQCRGEVAARVALALGRQARLEFIDAHRRPTQTRPSLSVDPVHSAMAEFEAARLRGHGFGVGHRRAVPALPVCRPRRPGGVARRARGAAAHREPHPLPRLPGHGRQLQRQARVPWAGAGGANWCQSLGPSRPTSWWRSGRPRRCTPSACAALRSRHSAANRQARSMHGGRANRQCTARARHWSCSTRWRRAASGSHIALAGGAHCAATLPRLRGGGGPTQGDGLAPRGGAFYAAAQRARSFK